jgi:hypothetical protein
VGRRERTSERRSRTPYDLLDASETLSAPDDVVVEDVDFAAELAELGVLRVDFLSVGGTEVSERSPKAEGETVRTRQW